MRTYKISVAMSYIPNWAFALHPCLLLYSATREISLSLSAVANKLLTPAHKSQFLNRIGTCNLTYHSENFISIFNIFLLHEKANQKILPWAWDSSPCYTHISMLHGKRSCLDFKGLLGFHA